MKRDMLPQFFHNVGVLLDYPESSLLETAHESVVILEEEDFKAAEQIKKFAKFVEDTPPGRLEEIYTGTFDVNPACYIYAGYLLFGEGFKRGKFMVRLKEKFREHGFPIGNELPDHIPLLFRFLAELEGDEILTQGGMVGKVTKVSDEKDFIEVALNDQTNIVVQKSAVSAVLPKGTMKSI